MSWIRSKAHHAVQESQATINLCHSCPSFYQSLLVTVLCETGVKKRSLKRIQEIPHADSLYIS